MEGPAFKVAQIACCVSGASRGFGRALADAVLMNTRRSVHFILCASRKSDELDETRGLLEAKANARGVELSTTLVACRLDDAADAHGRAQLAEAFEDKRWKHASQYFLFNNAGVLGNVNNATEDLGFEDYVGPLLVNAAGCGTLAGHFLRSTATAPAHVWRFIVHTSSAAALKPFRKWAPYAASKAASEMIHSIIAEEFRANNGAHPPTKVLQYAPGPLTTDMTSAVRADGRPPTSAPRWIPPSESAARVMEILRRDAYCSGEHVDFFDADHRPASDPNAAAPPVPQKVKATETALV